MIAPKVVKVLDLVKSHNPVLACESFLERAELWSLCWQLGATHAIGGLTGREERVVVVVAHLVHERVAHRWSRLVVDTVLATRGEKVALFHLVGPDT